MSRASWRPWMRASRGKDDLLPPVVRSEVYPVNPVVTGDIADVGGGDGVELRGAALHAPHVPHLLEEADVKLLGREFGGDEDVDGRRPLCQASAEAVGHARGPGDVEVAVVGGQQGEGQREEANGRVLTPARIDERHGVAGALRVSGDLGAMSGPPRYQVGL